MGRIPQSGILLNSWTYNLFILIIWIYMSPYNTIYSTTHTTRHYIFVHSNQDQPQLCIFVHSIQHRTSTHSYVYLYISLRNQKYVSRIFKYFQITYYLLLRRHWCRLGLINWKEIAMNEKDYYEKLNLFDSRINSTLQSICEAQGWEVSKEVLWDIQKMIMLCNEREKLWKTHMTEKLSTAFELTREKFPEWNPTEDK